VKIIASQCICFPHILCDHLSGKPGNVRDFDTCFVSFYDFCVTFASSLVEFSFSASEMTYIVSSGALNSTHSLTVEFSLCILCAIS